jgi:serine O-acetyltransferase
MTKGSEAAESAPVVDPAVSPWLTMFSDLLGRGVPSAYRIWQMGQKYIAAGDPKGAAMCEQLNYLLHNSSVPNSVILGEGVNFGYGGIGVVLHASSEIGRGVVIGTNVTLGGKTNTKGRGSPAEKPLYVPRVGDYAYLSTGCKILGGVEVGKFSIVGANAVVLTDVPALAVAAGAPAKIVKMITVENCLSYRGSFPALKNLTREEYVEMIRSAAA